MRVTISAFILSLAVCLIGYQAWAADEPAAAPAAEPVKEAAPPAPPPPPIPALSVRREQQQNTLLQKWYGEQTVSLKTSAGDFVGIWQEDTSGNPVGALLMLHDASQMPDWPAQLQPLRQYLSQHGWATLSISLPEPVPRALPPRPEPVKLPAPAPAEGAEAKNPDGTPAEASKQPEAKEKEPKDPAEKPADKDGQPPESKVVYNDANGKMGDGNLPPAQPPKPEVLPAPPAEPLAQERISAGLALLKEKQQYNNSLLGVGLGAARAAYFLVQHQGDPAQQAPGGAPLTPPFQALLMINPHMNITGLADFNLTQAFSNPKLPVLDISYRDHPAAPNAASIRKSAARKNNLAAFEQHLVQEPQGSDLGEEQVNRIVRGFLVKYAKGKQIKGGAEAP